MKTGKITNVKKIDDSLFCTVDFGAGHVEEQCILHGSAGAAEWPVKGDEVTVDIRKEENVIVALFRPLPGGVGVGDRWIFGRSSNGEIQSSVKLSSDGTVTINDGEEPAIKGDALSTFLTSSFSVSTAFGPSGPAITPIPENCLNRTVLI